MGRHRPLHLGTPLVSSCARTYWPRVLALKSAMPEPLPPTAGAAGTHARATLRRRGTPSHAQACAGVLPRTLSPAPHDAQSTWSSCGKARPAVRRTRHTCCKALYTTTGGCLLKGSTGHFDLLFEDDMDALGPGCRRHTGVEQRNAFRRNLPPADGSNALTHFSLITSSSHCS